VHGVRTLQAPHLRESDWQALADEIEPHTGNGKHQT
jgi:hypothetical protein